MAATLISTLIEILAYSFTETLMKETDKQIYAYKNIIAIFHFI